MSKFYVELTEKELELLTEDLYFCMATIKELVLGKPGKEKKPAPIKRKELKGYGFYLRKRLSNKLKKAQPLEQDSQEKESVLLALNILKDNYHTPRDQELLGTIENALRKQILN